MSANNLEYLAASDLCEENGMSNAAAVLRSYEEGEDQEVLTKYAFRTDKGYVCPPHANVAGDRYTNSLERAFLQDESRWWAGYDAGEVVEVQITYKALKKKNVIFGKSVADET